MALARALAVQPSILLLDEPFAALDRNLRLDMQIEVKRLQRQLGLTTILVTHDQDEAMSVADRIAVMNKGTVEQFDTPVAIYDRPQTLFVNGFIGTTNLLPGKVTALDNHIATVALDAGASLRLPASDGIAAGAAVLLSVRPGAATRASSLARRHCREAGRSSPASACRSARRSSTRRAPPTAPPPVRSPSPACSRRRPAPPAASFCAGARCTSLASPAAFHPVQQMNP